MSQENIIEVRGVSKSFGGLKAVSDCSLEVRKGSITGLIGPNGAGKSTTMKMITGFLEPDEGRVLIGDTDVHAHPIAAKKRIGYLPEESYLYRFLNAEETLDFYGRLFKISPKERRERAAELIEKVGLGHAKRRQLKEYSKGMTRRIGLAQALINNPDLVMLDEPTSGLDPLGTDDMKRMIVELKEQGKTVLMCSHLLADVQDVCDRIAILYGGELKVMGRVDDLLKEQEETQILTSRLSDEAIKEIEQVVAKHNGKVDAIDHPTATLESLFLKTVQESKERPGQRFVPETETKKAAE